MSASYCPAGAALSGSLLAAHDAPALKASPFPNQHEEEVLEGIWGFSAEERAALREAGLRA